MDDVSARPRSTSARTVAFMSPPWASYSSPSPVAHENARQVSKTSSAPAKSGSSSLTSRPTSPSRGAQPPAPRSRRRRSAGRPPPGSRRRACRCRSAANGGARSRRAVALGERIARVGACHGRRAAARGRRPCVPSGPRRRTAARARDRPVRDDARASGLRPEARRSRRPGCAATRRGRCRRRSAASGRPARPRPRRSSRPPSAPCPMALRVAPKTGLNVCEPAPHSGVFVLPTRIAPASRSRSTWSESVAGTWSRYEGEP